MTLPNLPPALGAIVTWLIEGARPADQPEEVIQRLCSQLVAAGLAIDRCAVFVGTLHPNIMGRRFVWNPEQAVEIREADQQVLESDVYRKSTVSVVSKSGKAIRCRLEAADCPDDYNIVDELRVEGFTDYVIYPLDFFNGENHAVSWATKRSGGFSESEILGLSSIRAPLARIAEIYALRRTAGNLLDTYVGHHTGRLIPEGSHP